MTKSKTYKISNKEWKQSLLTLRQDQAIFECLFDVGIEDISNIAEMKIADIIKILFKSKILIKLLQCILLPVTSEDSITEDEVLSVDNDQLEEIIVDFFLLNPKLKKHLKSFVGVLGGMSSTSISQPS
jgi:CRISPR/Cas system Type II protein with McrA/HNH and RuvC-like nuclease domain